MFAAALAAIVLGALNLWLGFGIVACALLVGGLLLGFRGLRAPLLLILGLYTVLLVLMARLEGSSRLLLGFPVATALLVYGIWPMPLLAGLLYGLVFRSKVLPEDRLNEFLASHARRKPSP